MRAPPPRAHTEDVPVTTAPAPTNAYSPTVTPGSKVLFAPNVAPRQTRVRSNSSRRETNARGRRTFVNTTLGPQNTSSSSSTPAYRLTLFCTRTPLPSFTPSATKQFCPSMQSLPKIAPAITWQKCQIFVPSPSSAAGSTQAVGCTHGLLLTPPPDGSRLRDPTHPPGPR